MKEINLEIQQLKEMNKQKDEKMNELKKNVDILKNKLENVQEELSTKIDSNEQLTDLSLIHI